MSRLSFCLRPFTTASLLLAFILIVGSASAQSAATVSKSNSWASIRAAVTSTFEPIKPEMQNFHLEFSLWSGDNLLSTGTIGVRKDEAVWFGLRSPKSSFRYLSRNASISCLLVTPSDTILFHADPGDYSPFPVVGIEKEASGGFRLDLTVNYRTFNGSEPAQFSVHPETAAYLTEKLKARYPFVVETPEQYALRTSETASDSVVVTKHENGTISGFTAFFPIDGQPSMKLQVNPLNVHGPFPALPPDWIPTGGRTPASGLDATVSFCRGFYGILSEIVQPADSR